MKNLFLLLSLFALTITTGHATQTQEQKERERAEAQHPYCIDYYRYSYNPVIKRPIPCEPYTCNPRTGFCKTSCLDNVDCADGYLCSLILGERTCQPVPQVD